MKEIRSYVLVGAFVVGAIFTPPDVVSQFMLAVPLYLLYELGILVAVFMGKPLPVKSCQFTSDEGKKQSPNETEAKESR